MFLWKETSLFALWLLEVGNSQIFKGTVWLVAHLQGNAVSVVGEAVDAAFPIVAVQGFQLIVGLFFLSLSLKAEFFAVLFIVHG